MLALYHNFLSVGDIEVDGSEYEVDWDSLYECQGPGDIERALPILSGCQVSGSWWGTLSNECKYQ